MITPWERVQKARDVGRAKPMDFVNYLFKDIIILSGDRQFADDASIYGGIAKFEDMPITFIAGGKAHTFEDSIKANFGMTNPEGYRKAMRLMKQAEKFNRPIITFVDTPGAYPGIGAEERGQGEAIARLIMEMQAVKVPTICIVTGEGGSGGALAISMGDRIYMLENAVYSILSPEGFSSILWKDKSQVERASDLMKLTSFDLKEFGIIDEIVEENEDFNRGNYEPVFDRIRELLSTSIQELCNVDGSELVDKRINRFRNIGR